MKQIISLKNTRHIIVVSSVGGIKIKPFKTKDDAYMEFIRLISTGNWEVRKVSSTKTIARLERTNTTITLRTQYQKSDFDRYMIKRDYKPEMQRGNFIVYKHKKNPWLYARVDIAKHSVKHIDIRNVK